MERLTSIVSRVLFIMAFILAGFAIWEKVANLIGYTFMIVYAPWRLIEFSVVVLLFIIPLQLREIKYLFRGKRSIE
jgi:hypothetical protein